MSLFILFAGLYLSGYLSCSQSRLSALQRNVNSTADPPFEDGNFMPLPASNAVQAIITTYQFQCDCVNITLWETYVHPGSMIYVDERAYDITFQVWRPSPTVNDTGCYSLVGENVFTNVSFLGGGLVQLAPTPPFIIAQSGDVVGYYTNSRLGSNEGIQINRQRNYDQNIVWFNDLESAPLSSSNNECPFPIGTNKALNSSTSAAPMLRVSTEVLCPTMTSSIMGITSMLTSNMATNLITSNLDSLDITTSSIELTIVSSHHLLSTNMETSSSSTPTDSTPGLTIILSCSILAGVVFLVILLFIIFIIIKLKMRSKLQQKSVANDTTGSPDHNDPNYDYIATNSCKEDCHHKPINENGDETYETIQQGNSSFHDVAMESNVSYEAISHQSVSKNNSNVDIVNEAVDINGVGNATEEDENEPYYY